MASTTESTTECVVPSSFSLLTWNIYGLEPKFLEERTEHICNYIHSKEPTVVYFQEVVSKTWHMITRRLNTKYHLFYGVPKAHYFNGILILKSPNIKCFEQEVVEFKYTRMGRYLLVVPVTYYGIDIRFMTSHIESLDRDHDVAERKRQMKTVFDLMQGSYEKSIVSIFGGDTNAKDHEIHEIGLPVNVEDAWEACGSKAKKKFTWNTHVPVVRIDRVYFTNNGPLRPSEFYLIGGEKMDKFGCYPSDHFGVWVDFKILQ